MRFLHVLVALLLVGSIAGLLERPAYADPPAPPTSEAASESDQLIEQGLELRKQGRDAEALPLFERAIVLNPSPRAGAQLALANQALGKWVEAERGLQTALLATDDTWVMQRRAALEKALATVGSQLGWLEVEANPRGAEILLDEKPVGVAPIPGPLRVPAGDVSLKVTAPGHVAAVRLVHVLPGEHAHEALSLQPEPPPNEEGSRRIDAVTASGIRATGEARPPSRPSRTLAWAALGSGAALLSGGAIATAVRDSNATSWNSPSCVTTTTDWSANCGRYQSAANTAGVLAVIGYATGGALALTSVVLFIRTSNETTAASSASAPRCGVGLSGVWCSGVF